MSIAAGTGAALIAADLQGTALGARLLKRHPKLGYVEVGRVVVTHCEAANDCGEEPRRTFTNHDFTEDQRLDDPRRG